MKASLCILLPTFDRYRWMADLTEARIEACWPQHPEVFRCGCSAPHDPRDLPLRRDARDWMGIALDAVSDLAARGYDKLYLILDDHPPLGPCHVEHLNVTMPRWMDELGAGYIGLNGWGQGRPASGGTILSDHLDLEQTGATFPWRFSLHPALWKVTCLLDVLSALTQTQEPDARSAWAFERRTQELAHGPAARWNAHAYRICGARTAAPTYRLRNTALRYLLQKTGGATVAAARLADQGTLAAMEGRFRFLYRHYRGPYPLYWSGLMSAGRAHASALLFLRLFGDRRLLAEFRVAAQRAGVSAVGGKDGAHA